MSANIFTVDHIDLEGGVIYATNRENGETVDHIIDPIFEAVIAKYKHSMLPMRFRIVLHLPNNYVLQPDFDAYDKLLRAAEQQRNSLALL